MLHVINGLTTGGAEAVLYRLVSYPSETKHEIICLEGRSWFSDKLAEREIRVHHLDWTSVRSACSGALRLYRLIKASGADVVQAWMYRSNLLAGVSCKLAGKRVIWNIRCSSLGPLRPASRLGAYIGGVLARWVPDFIINCSAESAAAHAQIGYNAAEGAVIPNGYDCEVFYPAEPAATAIRKLLNVHDGEFLVGTIARWDPFKDIPVLLRAIALLQRRGIPLRLMLVGRGLDGLNQELARLIKESRCGHLVHLVGERSDVPHIARSLDLHVLASSSEGFPNAVAETMLSGTVNVVTDVGDAALIVGDTGWVVPPLDPQLLAAAIEEAYAEWSSSPKKWEQRRKQARQRILENFSLDSMVRAYEEVWRKIAAKAE